MYKYHTTNGGDVMNKVPEMISTKDIAYIADIFEWNFIVCKKAHEFSKLVEDNDIKEELERVSCMHKNICDKLLKILE